MDAAVPPPSEGRIAIVTDVGSGCDGRTGRARRTAKSCGPDPPTLGSSPARRCAGRRWLSGPAHRGDHEAAVKTNRAGKAGCFGVDLLACFLSLHARLRVRCCIRPSLRPLFWAEKMMQNSGKSCRGNILACHCEPTGPREARPDDRLRDEAIRTVSAEAVWIASLRLQ
jgi:hypothetical protein